MMYFKYVGRPNSLHYIDFTIPAGDERQGGHTLRHILHLSGIFNLTDHRRSEMNRTKWSRCGTSRTLFLIESFIVKCINTLQVK